VFDQPEQQGQVLPRYARMPPGVPSFIGLDPKRFGRSGRRYLSENLKVRVRRKTYWGQSPIIIFDYSGRIYSLFF
jgi:hypothetical protein